MATRKVVLVLATAVVLGGCGYHLVGTASTLPEELTTLYVETFENLTPWTDMDQRVMESLNLEWVRRRRFELVTKREGADVMLSGVIMSVRVTPVEIDEQGRATKYQMALTSSVKFNDIRGDEPKLMWEDRAFSRRTSYLVDPNATNYYDRQLDAMDRVSQEFARALVSAVLEGF
jgi:outer membrane lipopolysaccharide assembly protein LptE/RlpB